MTHPTPLKPAEHNPHGVAIHQIYADNDPRAQRHLRVVRIEGPYAYCQGCTPEGVLHHPERAPTRARLDRFKPTRTGYRLVGVAP